MRRRSRSSRRGRGVAAPGHLLSRCAAALVRRGREGDRRVDAFQAGTDDEACPYYVISLRLDGCLVAKTVSRHCHIPYDPALRDARPPRSEASGVLVTHWLVHSPTATQVRFVQRGACRAAPVIAGHCALFDWDTAWLSAASAHVRRRSSTEGMTRLRRDACRVLQLAWLEPLGSLLPLLLPTPRLPQGEMCVARAFGAAACSAGPLWSAASKVGRTKPGTRALAPADPATPRCRDSRQTRNKDDAPWMTTFWSR